MNDFSDLAAQPSVSLSEGSCLRSPCADAVPACALARQLESVQSELLERTELLRRVIDESPDFIILKDQDGRFLLCNQSVADFYGTTPDAMVGKDDGDYGAPPELAAFYRRNVQDIMARGETEVVIEEARDARTGELVYFRSIKKPFVGPEGTSRILVIAHDISDMQAARKHLEASERRLGHALEATGDGVWDWHVVTGQLTVSRRWCEIFGYDPSELSGTLDDFWRCVPAEVAAELSAVLDQALLGDGDYLHEHVMRRRDGTLIWALDRGRVVERDEQGKALRMVGSIGDITEKVRALEDVRHQAMYDSLTGLFNRNALREKIERHMFDSDRTGEPVALLLLDIDEFKGVNDSLGHSAGDVLLQEAARRLLLCLGPQDAIGRWGGDEFIVVMSAPHQEQRAQDVAQRILHTMAEPFELGTERVYVSASVGITYYPRDGRDAESLMRNADQAMYAAKHDGRNRARCFSSDMYRKAQEHLRLVCDLREAMPEQQFHLVFQPIVALDTGHVSKAEALLRWVHPVRGPVSPAAFIPVVESSGLIHEIGEWIYREATRCAAAWQRMAPGFQVSVNVSPLQFQSGQIDIQAWLDHLGALDLDGRNVILEITEGLLMEAGPHVVGQMRAFRESGVQVALDDFGTGYSSLSYLNRLDIDYVKIDRSFVKDLAADSPVLALCEGIIMMAHKLGLKVVAEGVETTEQLALLRAAGCDHGQGYLFSHPVSPEALEELLRSGAALRPS